MTTFINKTVVALTLTLLVFGVFSYATSSSLFINQAEAVVGSSGDCGSCDDTPSTGGSTPDGGGGDGGEPKAPVCQYLKANGSEGKITVDRGASVKLVWSTTAPFLATLTPDGNKVDARSAKTVTVNEDTTFEIFVSNQVGSDSCTVTVEVAEPAALLPVCDSFTANGSSGPITVAENTPVLLQWETTNATMATISHGIGDVDPDGERQLKKANGPSQTFTLWIKNDAGEGTNCKVTVNVDSTVVHTPKCESFNVLQSKVEPGQNIRLQWETTGVTAASVNQNVGAVVVAEKTTVVKAPATVGTYTYIFTFDGETDDACRDTLEVADAPTSSAPRCDAFSINKTEVKPNENFTIDWDTTNASDVSINRIGAVNADGPTTHSESALGTYTYILTFDGETDADCRGTVKVVSEITDCKDPAAINYNPDADIADNDLCNYTSSPSFSCEENVTFAASDYSLDDNGGDIVLTWATTGLDSLSINGVASTNLNDSETVNVRSDITYILTGLKAGEEPLTCPVSIDVASGGGGGGGGSSRPRCDLDISDETISRGDSVTLSWETWNTREIVLEDDDGNVLVESDDRDDLDGEITIKPTKDTTFTLTASRGSRDRECEVEVEVGGGVSLSQVRQQFPTVAGISLTQVPYTGFEAGPMMTFIFYALLAIWGLFVAYVIAVRKNIIGGASLAGAHDHTPYVEASVPASDTQESSVAAGYVAAATTAPAPSNLPTAEPAVVGYAALNTKDEAEIPEMTEAELDASMHMTELENRAHMQKTLFSSDAMRYFTKNTPEAEQLTALDTLVAKAKGMFPTEDGWVVVNLARLESLMETVPTTDAVVTETKKTNGGSLAEAIVSGNVVAAYQMIASRPMIALADAAAELDTIVRARGGEAVAMSDMLAAESAKLSDEQLRAAIHALTSALDGTYTSEEDAVKMAIMKAVKAVA